VCGRDQTAEAIEIEGWSGLQVGVAELAFEQANLAAQVVQASSGLGAWPLGAADGKNQPGVVALNDDPLIGDELPIALPGRLPPGPRRWHLGAAGVGIAEPPGHGHGCAAVQPLETPKGRAGSGQRPEHSPPGLELGDLGVRIQEDK
jgi:hypothetical protein